LAEEEAEEEAEVVADDEDMMVRNQAFALEGC